MKTQIETIEQFEQRFNLNLGETNIYGYSMMRHDSLAQIDIDQAMFRLGYRKEDENILINNLDNLN